MRRIRNPNTCANVTSMQYVVDVNDTKATNKVQQNVKELFNLQHNTYYCFLSNFISNSERKMRKKSVQKKRSSELLFLLENVQNIINYLIRLHPPENIKVERDTIQ
ncbi:CLUMA_CG019838, isoform A [Clunio marinus]|uniref:CLUMA_CG019838, isoform A n=1 Tax=Clunio marinus TaxID=568069 RepID=A0A1J1J3Z1_9DIPT|nr:CLUMA_CG019838, isoform A [Clunio marinus]